MQGRNRCSQRMSAAILSSRKRPGGPRCAKSGAAEGGERKQQLRQPQCLIADQVRRLQVTWTRQPRRHLWAARPLQLRLPLLALPVGAAQTLMPPASSNWTEQGHCGAGFITLQPPPSFLARLRPMSIARRQVGSDASCSAPMGPPRQSRQRAARGARPLWPLTGDLLWIWQQGRGGSARPPDPVSWGWVCLTPLTSRCRPWSGESGVRGAVRGRGGRSAIGKPTLGPWRIRAAQGSEEADVFSRHCLRVRAGFSCGRVARALPLSCLRCENRGVWR